MHAQLVASLPSHAPTRLRLKWLLTKDPYPGPLPRPAGGACGNVEIPYSALVASYLVSLVVPLPPPMHSGVPGHITP